MFQTTTSETATKWGNRVWSLPIALLESQLFKWERVGDDVDTYYHSGTLALITHWWLLIVIFKKDEVVSCCNKHNERLVSSKRGTTIEISSKLKDGKIVFVHLSACVRVRVWGMGKGSRLTFYVVIFF